MRPASRAPIVLVALVLGGCGTSASQGVSTGGSGGTSLGRPIASASSASTGGSSTERSAARGRNARRAAAAATPTDSVRLPPPPSPGTPRSQAILRVARRFANAYVQYQIGRDTAAIDRAIRETCTPTFARLLLSQPVSIPRAQQRSVAARPAEVTRVLYTGPASLGPGPPVQIVLARYREVAPSRIGGQLTIEVTGGGRWRVSGLR